MRLCEHVVLLGVATTGPETQKRELTSLGLSLLLCQARELGYMVRGPPSSTMG